MFQNMKANRVVYLNNIIGFLQILVGGFFSLIFGFSLIGCFMTMFGPKKTTGFGETIIILIIFILFAYMLNRGFKRRRLNRVYYTYTQQLMQNATFSIDQLALILRMPLNSVRKDIETMVKKGFIDSVNIDDRTYNQHSQNDRTEKSTLEPNTMANIKSVNEPKFDEYVDVICKNCGASNKILKGSAVNCEYCGSMMKYE